MSHDMPCNRIRFDGINDGIPIFINLKPLLRLSFLAVTGGESVRLMLIQRNPEMFIYYHIKQQYMRCKQPR